MFDSFLFNQYYLFQKFSGLCKKLNFVSQVDELLYCLNSAILRLIAIKEYNFECVKEYLEREKFLTVINTPRIAFFSSNLVRLLNEIPIFFSDMKKAQDIFLSVLALELDLKEKPPKNMNKAIKNTLEKYKIPSEISSLIYNYWEQSGKSIKDYRDMDQHWHQIVQRTWLQLEPEKKIIVILPDSKHELTYEKKINALELLEKSFYDYHELVEKISEFLGYDKNTPFPTQIPMNPPVYIIPGQEDFLFSLVAFDKGPISGVALHTKKGESIIFTQLPNKL